MSASVTEQQVLDALSTIEDPDLHKDIVSLGFIKDLQISGGKVSFKIQLTTPACPVKEQMQSMARQAVVALPGVESVEIEMTASVPKHGGMGETQEIPGIRNILAVASGKGGVGKTTCSVNLALALSQKGARVGLMDGDVYGPNVPQMMAANGQPLTDGERILPSKAYGISVLSMGQLTPKDQPIMWRGPMLHSVVQQFLKDTQWGELDYLLVDLPPGTGDVQLSLIQTVPLAGAVVVTTPAQVAIADVRRAIQMFNKLEVPVLGVLENMHSFVAPDTGNTYHIFGKGGGQQVADEYDVPFLGGVPIDPRIAEGSDTGKPIVIADPDSPPAKAFQEIATQVAAQVSVVALQASVRRGQVGHSHPVQIGGLSE